MQLNLEQWPGGRWYRDRGNGIGHLWGARPPVISASLFELSGYVHVVSGTRIIELKLEEQRRAALLTSAIEPSG
ncbi:MAG: hypothetical protein U0Q16_12075 [Bryobacteraceae bacterium]